MRMDLRRVVYRTDRKEKVAAILAACPSMQDPALFAPEGGPGTAMLEQMWTDETEADPQMIAFAQACGLGDRWRRGDVGGYQWNVPGLERVAVRKDRHAGFVLSIGGWATPQLFLPIAEAMFAGMPDDFEVQVPDPKEPGRLVKKRLQALVEETRAACADQPN